MWLLWAGGDPGAVRSMFMMCVFGKPATFVTAPACFLHSLSVPGQRAHCTHSCAARNRGVRESWRAIAPCGKAPYVRTSCGRAPCSQLVALSPPQLSCQKLQSPLPDSFSGVPLSMYCWGNGPTSRTTSWVRMGSHLLHSPLLFVNYSRMSRV